MIQYGDIDIFFDKGLDQGTDEKLSRGFSRLTNAQWLDEGSLSKRWGYDALVTSSLGTYTSATLNTAEIEDLADDVNGLGVRMQGLDEELVAFCSSSIWSYDDNVDTLLNRGERKRCRVNSFLLPGDTDSRIDPAIAVSGDVRVVAWATISPMTGSSNFSQWFAVLDAETNRTIIPKRQIGSTSTTLFSNPKVVAFSNYIHVVYLDRPTAGTLALYSLPISVTKPWQPSSPVRIGSTSTATDNGGTVVSNSRLASIGTSVNTFDAMLWNSSVHGASMLTAHVSGSGAWLCATDSVGQAVYKGQLYVTGSALTDIMGLAATPHAVQLASLVTTGYGSVHVNLITTKSLATVDAMNESDEVTLQPVNVTGYQDLSGSTAYTAVAYASGSDVNSHMFEWLVNWQGKLSGSKETASSDADIAFDNRAYSYVRKYTLVDGQLASSETLLRHCEAQSYPFTASLKDDFGENIEKTFLHTAFIGSNQNLGMVVDMSGSVWGVYNRDYSYPTLGTKSRVASKHPMRFDAAMGYAGRGYTSGSNVKGDVSVVRLDLDPDETSIVSFGDMLIHGGGQARSYDGVNDVELGFNAFPFMASSGSSDVIHTTNAINPHLTFQAISGTTILAGRYLYYSTYHWYDAQGREHRSSPGVATFETDVNVGGVLVTVPRLRATDKQGVVTRLWRTDCNGGTPYFVMSDAVYDEEQQWDYVRFYDYMTDATLIDPERRDIEVLYSVGELANDPPPQSSIIAVWDSRLWLVDDNDGLKVWFSKVHTSDLAPEFSVYQTIEFGPEGGAITAMHAMDDKLIVFKGTRVFVIYGTGPDAMGLNGGYRTQEIVSDVGCESARSVVNISSLGLIFVSKKGIYLLGRDLNVTHIGAPVDDDALSNEITGITVDEKQHLVRFACRSGKQIVYDTGVMRWTLHDIDGSLDCSIDAVTVYDGKHTIAGKSGSNHSVVYAVSSGSYDDAGSGYAMTIRSPWIAVAGPHGQQAVKEVQFLGDFRTEHEFNIGVQYDYNDDTSRNYTSHVSGSTISNVVSGSLFAILHRPHIRRCTSMRVEVSDSAQTGSMESYRLQGIRFKVAPKGTNILPKGRRVT